MINHEAESSTCEYVKSVAVMYFQNVMVGQEMHRHSHSKRVKTSVQNATEKTTPNLKSGV